MSCLFVVCIGASLNHCLHMLCEDCMEKILMKNGKYLLCSWNITSHEVYNVKKRSQYTL